MNAPDYPAAHSMDTDWFAVDGRGHVGIFVTYEPGHMPAALPEQAYAYEVVEPLLAQMFPGYAESEESDHRDVFEDASECGLFVYKYPDDYSSIGLLYRRERVPRQPLHVDQLPPELRVVCQRQRFDAVDFTRDEVFQPAEHVECKGWHLEAYLDRDGVTVRPLPGREESFGDFVRNFLKENPEKAACYVFVPPPSDTPEEKSEDGQESSPG